jgi:hypothetical protein
MRQNASHELPENDPRNHSNAILSIALADDFKTLDGKEYKNATINRVEPDGIVLKSKSGISKVYFTELPKEVQQRFNYDPQRAATYSAQQNADYGAYQKHEEEAERQREDAATQNNAGFGQQQPGAENNRSSGRQTKVNAKANSLTEDPSASRPSPEPRAQSNPPPGKPGPKPAPVHHEKAQGKKSKK